MFVATKMVLKKVSGERERERELHTTKKAFSLSWPCTIRSLRSRGRVPRASCTRIFFYKSQGLLSQNLSKKFNPTHSRDPLPIWVTGPTSEFFLPSLPRDGRRRNRLSPGRVRKVCVAQSTATKHACDKVRTDEDVYGIAGETCRESARNREKGGSSC